MSKRSKRSILPLYAWIFYGIAVLALVIYLAAVASPVFAAWFQGGVGAAVRAALAHATSWIPFSLAEFLLYLVPFLLVFIGVHAWRHHCATWGTMFRYLASLIAVFSIFFSLFVFSFGAGYHTETLDKRLGLAVTDVSAADLEKTAKALVSELNALAPNVTYGEDGFSLMPYDLDEMNDCLLVAYERVSAEHTFIQSLQSRIKPVQASHAMSYTHITGIYTYFTGEANLNIYFPDYTLPFTAAHEQAHQRGIARENEANFVAFLVTAASDDPYIRYCGYLNLYEYVTAALYAVAPDAHFACLKSLDPAVVGELRAYGAFFEEFEGSAAANVSDAVNDTYLKLHGNEAGTASYGLVVDLAVAYYRDK